MRKFLNVEHFNKSIQDKTLLIKYFPKVNWEGVNEELSLETGNFFYKGIVENYRLDFYSRIDRCQLNIWSAKELVYTSNFNSDINSTLLNALAYLQTIQRTITKLI